MIFIEYGYRLFIEKTESYANDRITSFVQQYIPNVAVERSAPTEMTFGVFRTESKRIPPLIRAFDEQSQQVGIDSYGLSMTTIEDVFLK